MSKNKIFWLAMVLASVSCVRAQGWPTNGLYQIVSGRYTECCGFGGTIAQTLPNASQGFIALAVDPLRNLAQLTFLGPDRQTVFRVYPVSPGGGFSFSFSNGMVFPDHLQFGDPILMPRPGEPSWSYSVSNSADALRIHGAAITPQVGADIPNEFKHTNVVAVLVPAAPVIEGLERDGALLRFRFTGEPPNDFFVEFSESLAATNWLCLTNYRAKLQTIEAVVTDSLTNSAARFYRVRKQDCKCD